MKHILVAALTAAAIGALAPTPAAAADTTYPKDIIAAPGIRIYTQGSEGPDYCTLSYAATSRTTGYRYAITAGHCGTAGTDVYTTGHKKIGTFVDVQNDQIAGHIFGYGLIGLDENVTPSAHITRDFAVTTFGQATTGDYVCFFGTTSGMNCGAVGLTRPDVAVLPDTPSAGGDSGAPIVRMSDRAIVGILISGNQRGETSYEPISHIQQLTGPL